MSAGEGSGWSALCLRAATRAAGAPSKYTESQTDWLHIVRRRSRALLFRCTVQTYLPPSPSPLPLPMTGNLLPCFTPLAHRRTIPPAYHQRIRIRILTRWPQTPIGTTKSPTCLFAPPRHPAFVNSGPTLRYAHYAIKPPAEAKGINPEKAIKTRASIVSQRHGPKRVREYSAAQTKDYESR